MSEVTETTFEGETLVAVVILVKGRYNFAR